MREPILVDYDRSTMVVPHLGVTLRVMIGAALADWPSPQPNQRRVFSVVYKGVNLAQLSVKQHPELPI